MYNRPPKYGLQAKKIQAALSRCKVRQEDTNQLSYGGSQILSKSDVDRGFFGESFSLLSAQGLVYYPDTSVQHLRITPIT